MRDGSIGCPVLVVAATGDPLFGFGYTQRVFDRIVAPAKELLVFEVDRRPWSVRARSRPTAPATITGAEQAFVGVASARVSTADISR